MAPKRQLRYFLMARGRFAEELHMADKRTTPEEAASGGPRKRAAPTIDLTATEVPPASDQETVPPAEGAPGGDPPNEPSDNSWVWLRANISGSGLAAGTAGAAIMTLVLCGLWLTGLVPARTAGSTLATAVDTKTIDA